MVYYGEAFCTPQWVLIEFFSKGILSFVVFWDWGKHLRVSKWFNTSNKCISNRFNKCINLIILSEIFNSIYLSCYFTKYQDFLMPLLNCRKTKVWAQVCIRNFIRKGRVETVALVGESSIEGRLNIPTPDWNYIVASKLVKFRKNKGIEKK